MSDIFEKMYKTGVQLQTPPPLMGIDEISRIYFDLFFLNGEQNLSTKKKCRYPEAAEAKLEGSEGMLLRIYLFYA